MTPDDIAKARAIIAAATPGPWDTISGSTVRAVNVEADLAVPIFDGRAPIDWHKKKNITHSVLCRAYADEVNNATFIAAARTGWPAALDEIERLHKLLSNPERGAKP